MVRPSADQTGDALMPLWVRRVAVPRRTSMTQTSARGPFDVDAGDARAVRREGRTAQAPDLVGHGLKSRRRPPREPWQHGGGRRGRDGPDERSARRDRKLRQPLSRGDRRHGRTRHPGGRHTNRIERDRLDLGAAREDDRVGSRRAGDVDARHERSPPRRFRRSSGVERHGSHDAVRAVDGHRVNREEQHALIRDESGPRVPHLAARLRPAWSRVSAHRHLPPPASARLTAIPRR